MNTECSSIPCKKKAIQTKESPLAQSLTRSPESSATTMPHQNAPWAAITAWHGPTHFPGWARDKDARCLASGVLRFREAFNASASCLEITFANASETECMHMPGDSWTNGNDLKRKPLDPWHSTATSAGAGARAGAGAWLHIMRGMHTGPLELAVQEKQYIRTFSPPAKLRKRSTAEVTGTWIKNLAQRAKVSAEVPLAQQTCP